jgi:cbb3-type cytochrome c oxidase subunit III
MLNHARHNRRTAGSALIVLFLAIAGCATTEAPAATPASSAISASPSSATTTLVAAGDRLFHENSCIACHGEDAKGTSVAPNLADATWLTGDGSIGAITKIISEGVDEPKQFASPMPAMGGADLSPDDIKAVAAYVWSISHK